MGVWARKERGLGVDTKFILLINIQNEDMFTKLSVFSTKLANIVSNSLEESSISHKKKLSGGGGADNFELSCSTTNLGRCILVLTFGFYINPS